MSSAARHPWWRQYLHQSRLETTTTLLSAPFIVLLALGLSFVIGMAFEMGSNRGTLVEPVTHLMLRSIDVSMKLVLTIIVVFLGGELVWRERSQRLDQIYDALPVPTVVLVTAKITALVAVVLVFIGTSMVATVVLQLSRGFTRLEPGLYLRGLPVLALPFILYAVLSVFLQVLANNKFIGYLLMIIVIASRVAMPMLGLEHNLYRFAGHPGMLYSDMNGYGHFTAGFLWFGLYWSLFAALLVCLCLLLWPRGTETTLRIRLGLAAQRSSGRLRTALGIVAAACVACGCWIFYNTNVVNDYRPRSERIRRLAAYETQYGEYRDIDLLRLTAIQAQVDLYPEERRALLRGSYQLHNPHQKTITILPITISPRNDHGYLPVTATVTLDHLEMGPHNVVVADQELGFFVYELHQGVPPGGSLELGWQVTVDDTGFKNNLVDTRIVTNGTFFANRNYFPWIGYARTNQLNSVTARRRNRLPALERTAAIDDPKALGTNYLEADWIDLEATVSTSADQLAVTSGSLVNEWVAGDRRYFHYRTEVPIINLFVVASAAYEVRRDCWGDVAVEVYFHPEHDRNIDRMFAASKAALDYYSDAYGPYPHDHLRIVEVPNYIGLTAFGLAGVVPFSEAWGFIMEVGDGDIDMVSNVTAHEIAHQWWNHQVIGAHAQGATLIAESLSEYSALMVMEKQFGPQMVRHYLRYELDRYLSARGHEQLREQPLLLVENQQYIHYFKGSLAMYALRDAIGEEAINRALSRFCNRHAFSGPPYPTARMLLAELSAEVPERLQYLMEDLFETITFHDNRATAATFVERPDGTYLVTLHTSSRKLRADGRGAERPVPVDDWIDIGVFGRDDTPLFLEKRHITEEQSRFELMVQDEPWRAGIDPLTKLIDRNPNDNTTRVVKRSE